MSISEAFERLLADGLPIRFTAYDGSSAGEGDAPCSRTKSTVTVFFPAEQVSLSHRCNCSPDRKRGIAC